MSCTKGHMVQIGRVYIASCQRSTVSSTAHVHILGAEIGFERGICWGEDNKIRSPCIGSRPCIFGGIEATFVHKKTVFLALVKSKNSTKTTGSMSCN